MKYALSASQMKSLDQMTIQEIGIESLVLMERAALGVVEEIKKHVTLKDRILVVCGSGNNGGDGFAVARILLAQGHSVDAMFVGSMAKMTLECKKQMQIAVKMGLSMRTELLFSEYNIIVDGIFGIGLDRPVHGEFANVIERINEQKESAFVIAIDIPSGISADTGQKLDYAVKADVTVTFQEMKRGLLLYPGAEYAGNIIVKDVGIMPYQFNDQEVVYRYYEPEDIHRLLPKRMDYSNKGSYGKVLIVAGSDTITGAAYLSAMSAYRMGTGLVKILTAASIIPILRTQLPEALFVCYDGKNASQEIENAVKWASAIVIGPGLSMSEQAKLVFTKVCDLVKKTMTPMVMDADALNILSEQIDQESKCKEKRLCLIKERVPANTILTPHLLEFSRLTLETVHKIPSILIDITEECTYNSELTYVLKDTRTIVASKNLRYINRSGNNGMATGGSGDVLTGIIAALLAEGLNREEAATLGVYLHGLAGDYARKKLGAYSMLARDIIEALSEVLMNYERRKL
ncbi:MAG: NAD(P)H-hydrate dehydratase [Clostridiales bacterium]|nr:NAD(P)H-hydrate dehydratase [Clostridiales bacterium]